MSTLTQNSGLGIELCPSESFSTCNSISASRSTFAAALLPAISAPLAAPAAPSSGTLTVRSSRAMRGLLLAEVGDGMVELDLCEGGGLGASGFRQGQRFALATPGGGGMSEGTTTKRANPASSHLVNLPLDLAFEEGRQEEEEITSNALLARHGTLLTVGAPPARNAAELKSLLGNSNAKLKPKAAVLPRPVSREGYQGDVPATPVALEQAKRQARVSLDIVLSNSIGVQGSYLSGHIRVCIRKSKSQDSPILVASEGKVRAVGFECIPHGGGEERFVFYQCGGRLRGSVWKAGQVGDEEGFGEGREGVHVLPFRLFLPPEGQAGDAKGGLSVHGGVTVRYIAMASIKVKDPVTGKRSIAHFYRDVEIYPRLDPSVLLLPASHPIQSTTSKCLFRGGPGKLQLAALLHRLHFVAGQRCYIQVRVLNETKKTVRSLTITLLRTTTVFEPRPHLNMGASDDVDADACETITMVKEVAESTLQMGDQGAKGHASAKGWWTGVTSGQSRAFEHYIVLPAEALSVPRGRLLEVEYTLRVSLSAGSLASDVQVALPIRILNFLSIDPPHSWPLAPIVPTPPPPACSSQENEGKVQPAIRERQPTRTAQEIFESPGPRVLDTLVEASEQSTPNRGPGESEHVQDMDRPYDHLLGEQDHALKDGDASLQYGDTDMSAREYENSYAVDATREQDEDGERPPRFADLYHASVQEQSTGQHKRDVQSRAQLGGVTTHRQPPAGARRQPNFAARVQEKLQALPVHQQGEIQDCQERDEDTGPDYHLEEIDRNHVSSFIYQRECPSTVSALSARHFDDDDRGLTGFGSDSGAETPSVTSVFGDQEYVNVGVAEFHEQQPFGLGDEYTNFVSVNAQYMENPKAEPPAESRISLRQTGSRMLPPTPVDPTQSPVDSRSRRFDLYNQEAVEFVRPLVASRSQTLDSYNQENAALAEPRRIIVASRSRTMESYTRREEMVGDLQPKRPALRAGHPESNASVKNRVAEFEQRMKAARTREEQWVAGL